jgi:DNA polymerase I-like protein with 3'-5' exonuclease and polymerase domains
MTNQLRIWDSLTDDVEAKFLSTIEITAPESIPTYLPMPTYRLRNVLYNSLQKDSFGVDDCMDHVKNVYKEQISRNLRKDTVVFFPFYSSSEAFGDTPYDQHNNVFSKVLTSLKNVEGEIPRIVCTASPDTIRKSERRLSKHDKLQEVEQCEENVKAKDMTLIAWSFRNWLKEHPEVKNVVVTDITLMARMFPNYNFPSSFRDCAYRSFDVDPDEGCLVKNTKGTYKVMLIANHHKHRSNDDLVYTITADMLSILMNPASEPVSPKKYKILTSIKQLNKVIDQCLKKGRALSLDIETTGLNPVINGQKIISCALSDGETAWSFLVDHPKYTLKDQNALEGLRMLRKVVMTKQLILILQNAVYDLKWITHFLGAYPTAQIRDTMLIDHWLFETQGSVSKKMGLGYGYGMDNQIPRYLRVKSHKDTIARYKEQAKVINDTSFPSGKKLMDITVVELEGWVSKLNSPEWREPKSGSYAQFPLRVLLKYNMKDAFYTYKIFMKQVRMIKQECGGKIPKIFTYNMPKNIKNAAMMELNGMPIDYDLLKDKIIYCTSKMKKHKEAFLSVMVGLQENDVNIESEDVLKKILKKYFNCTDDDFYDPVQDKSSMQSSVIRDLAKNRKLEFLDDYLAYKKYVKARNTYFIPFLFHSYMGRIYYSINVTGTVTGRFSSNNPNVQNIPKAIKTATDKVFVKEVLRCEKDCKLIDLDLAAAEIKVLTTVCPDPTLIRVLKNGMDAHCYTASLVIKEPYEKILAAKEKSDDPNPGKFTKDEIRYLDMRQKAKRTNFGAIYRIGPRGLSSQLKIKDELGDINPFTKKPYTRRSRHAELRRIGEREAELLLTKLFTEVFPTLESVFEETDKQVFENYYAESIFGRRRRYLYTPIPAIHKLLVETGLYTGIKDDVGKLKLTDALYLIPSKRPFRQSMNFGVQSAASDYMQLFIAYLVSEAEVHGLKLKVHLTVHDSVLFSYSGTKEDTALFRKICDRGMNDYLMKQSDKLPIPIGYSLDLSTRYCEPPNAASVPEKK